MLRYSAVVVLVAVMAAVGAYENEYFTNSTINRTSFRGKCPIILGKIPFEPSKMEGEWQIAAGTPLFGNEVSRCSRFKISSRRSNYELFYDVVFTAKRDDKAYSIESTAQAYRPERGSFMLAVYRLKGTDKWSAPFGQSIVATDYETYALFVACRPDFSEETNRFERRLAAQVWVRPGVSTSPEKLYALKNLLTSYDVAGEDIKDANQENCS